MRYTPGVLFLILSLLFVGFIQILRFHAIDQSPPGFYMDEATGAAQSLCIKHSGEDFFGTPYPLFSPSLSGGFFTPLYIYGQMVWTTIFGESIAAFRSFLAFITVLTILVFGAFVRRWAGSGTAIWFLILASISPWAWQFSRIAWDPPLAVFFLGIGIWVFTSERKWSPWLGGFLFACAAYSYPPTRLQAGMLIVLMPGVLWRDKLKTLFAFGVTMIPLFIRSMDDDFRSRGNLVGIWSNYEGNPYAYQGIFGMAIGVVKNFWLHIAPDFTVVHGDSNLRHSTYRVGVMSYPQAFALVVGGIAILSSKIRKAMTPSEWSLLWIGALGAFSGVLPAAMTWEGVPHALRSIAAWPFFCILAAVALSKISQRWPVMKWVALAGSIAFAYFYLDDFFNAYPDRSRHWFQVDNNAFGLSYQRMTEQGMSCSQVRGLPGLPQH